MDDFFTHNLHCWVERFRNFAHIGRPPMADGVTKIVNILHDEMHALSDPWKWEGQIKESIQTEVKTEGDAITGRVGPGVGGAPKHMPTAEAGRSPGLTPPPYAPGTRLYAWAADHGLEAFVRPISIRIGERGLPNLETNPNWKHEPPTFVERSMMTKEGEIEAAVKEIGVVITREFTGRILS